MGGRPEAKRRQELRRKGKLPSLIQKIEEAVQRDKAGLNIWLTEEDILNANPR